MTNDRRARIRALNDQLRMRHCGGRILLSAGIVALPPSASAAILLAVAFFDAFDESNDPYGEHDFGCVTVQGVRAFWKIDYYDQSLTSAAVDPADPSGCVRVLTIMLAEEY